MAESQNVELVPGGQSASLVASRLVAGAMVASCFCSVQYRFVPNWLPETWLLVAVIAVIILRDGDVSELGLRLHPQRGWWHWCRLALWAGIAIGIIGLVWLGFVYVAGIKLHVPMIEPHDRWSRFLYMCVYAPLVEELIFRSMLTTAVRPSIGDRGTIIASGLLFAAGHIQSGNPSPENQIAGFFLAWAFLRSGTILVPLLWHAAGNLVAYSAQVASWHWLPEQWP